MNDRKVPLIMSYSNTLPNIKAILKKIKGYSIVILRALRVSEANEVPIGSHIWVTSTTFKQF